MIKTVWLLHFYLPYPIFRASSSQIACMYLDAGFAVVMDARDAASVNDIAFAGTLAR